MLTGSRSHHRSFILRALAIIVAGALAGCGRSDDSPAAGVSVAAGASTDAAHIAVQALPASQRVAVDTASVTPPPPALPGQPNVSEVIVTLEPVAYDSIAPADVLLTDPAGRRAGMESATWRAVLEIPSTTYDSSPPLAQMDGDPVPGGLVKELRLVTPLAGHYALQVIGRRNGTYTLSVELVTPRALSRKTQVRAQKIRSGEIHVFRFTYDDNRGPLTLRRQDSQLHP